MPDGDDSNLVGADFIEETVVADNHLTHGGARIFRDDPSRPREPLQATKSTSGSLLESPRGTRIVLRDELENLHELGESGAGESYLQTPFRLRRRSVVWKTSSSEYVRSPSDSFRARSSISRIWRRRESDGVGRTGAGLDSGDGRLTQGPPGPHGGYACIAASATGNGGIAVASMQPGNVPTRESPGLRITPPPAPSPGASTRSASRPRRASACCRGSRGGCRRRRTRRSSSA